MMDTHLLSMLTLSFTLKLTLKLDQTIWSSSLFENCKSNFFRILKLKFCQDLDVEVWLCFGQCLIMKWSASLCLTMPAKGYLFREPSCFNAFGYISCGWFSRLVHMVSSIICKPKTGHKVKIFAYQLSIFLHSLVKTLAPVHTHARYEKLHFDDFDDLKSLTGNLLYHPDVR